MIGRSKVIVDCIGPSSSFISSDMVALEPNSCTSKLCRRDELDKVIPAENKRAAIFSSMSIVMAVAWS